VVRKKTLLTLVLSVYDGPAECVSHAGVPTRNYSHPNRRLEALVGVLCITCLCNVTTAFGVVGLLFRFIGWIGSGFVPPTMLYWKRMAIPPAIVNVLLRSTSLSEG
jgi:hypothetical protein